MRLVAELDEGDREGEEKATDEDVEDPGDVAQRQLVTRCVLLVAVSALRALVPPFVHQLG